LLSGLEMCWFQNLICFTPFPKCRTTFSGCSEAGASTGGMRASLDLRRHSPLGRKHLAPSAQPSTRCTHSSRGEWGWLLTLTEVKCCRTPSLGSPRRAAHPPGNCGPEKRGCSELHPALLPACCLKAPPSPTHLLSPVLQHQQFGVELH